MSLRNVLAVVVGLLLAGAAQAGLTDGLVSYWDLEDTSIGAVDAFGVHDGTISGTVTAEPGKIGNAFHFDGSTGWVDVGNVGGIDGDVPRTIAGWVNSDLADPPYDWITCFGFSPDSGGDNTFFDIEVVNGNQYGMHVYSWQSATGPLDPGNWHFAVGTYDGTTITWYMDGQNRGSTDRALNTGVDSFKIGQRVASSHYFEGLVDEVAVWDRVLTDDEVTQLWNNGDGLYLLADGTLVSTGTAPSEWHLTTSWTGDVPGGIPTGKSSVSVDGHTVTVTTSGAEAYELELINGGQVIVNTTQSLSAGSIDTSGGTLTVPSGATVEAGKMNTAGLSVVSGSVVNISDELNVDSAIDLTGVVLDASAGGVKLSTGGALTHTGALSVAVLTADGGALNLGGNNLTVTDTLNVTGAFDTTGPNLGDLEVATARVNLAAGGTFTVNAAIAPHTLAFSGGTLAGSGSVIPTNQYVIENTTVSRDLSGPAELIVSGNSGLTGNNTYAGKTVVSGGGTLRFTDLDQNVGAGHVEINNGYLASSGTISRTIGTGDGQISFAGNFGFVPDGGDLTVTLARNDGQDLPLEWNSATNGFGGNTLMVNHAVDHTLEITNDIDMQGSRTFNFGRTSGAADVDLKFSGNITGGQFGVWEHRNGWDYRVVWLSGDTVDVSTIRMWEGGILRLVSESTGLYNRAPDAAFAEIYYGRIETNGTFQFKGKTEWGNLGNTEPGYIVFNNWGGISAYGGDLTFEMSGELEGDPWSLTDGAFFHFFGMTLNSQYSDAVVTIKGDVENGIGGEKDNWGIRIYNNPDTDADYARLEGNWSMETMFIDGINNSLTSGGIVELVEGFTITTDSTQGPSGEFTVQNSAEFRLNGTLDARDGGNVIIRNSARLSGTGTVIGLVDVQGGTTIAPGNSGGTLTIDGDLQLAADSTYECEVDDLIAVVGDLDIPVGDVTVELLDSEFKKGGTMPIFTYGSFDDALGNLVLDPTALVDGGLLSQAEADALFLTDVANEILLNGLSGASPALPGDANDSGFVDDDDLAILLSNWESDPGTITTWELGDFTVDTDVDDDDLAVLLGNWTGSPPGGAAVPEPATLALLGLGGLAMLRRRRK